MRKINNVDIKIHENTISDAATDSDVLQRLLVDGTIDPTVLSLAREQIRVDKRREFLQQHTNNIWQGQDGKWYTHLPDDKRTLKKRSSRESLEDAIIEYYQNELYDPTIREVFDAAMDRRVAIRKIDPNTRERYGQDFDRFYAEFGKRKIKSVSLKDFSNFLEEQIAECDLTSKAFLNLKTITGHLVNYAYDEELISFGRYDLFRNVQTTDRQFKCRIIDDQKEVFSIADAALIRQYLIEHQDIWNLGILLMFVAGLRIGELVTLKWSDIFDGAMRIQTTETRHKVDGRYHYDVKDRPKTMAGFRMIPVPADYQWIFEAIRELNDDEEFLFVRNGKRLTTNCIRARLRRVNEKVGLIQRSPNKVRKTYCSILCENDVDDLTITKLMGHTDISCAKNHYIRDRHGLADKIKTVSAIPDFTITDSTSQKGNRK